MIGRLDVPKRILECSSVVLDSAYELTGRRLKVLRRSAALLYDLSQWGQEPQEGSDCEAPTGGEEQSVDVAQREEASAGASEEAPAVEVDASTLNGKSHQAAEQRAEEEKITLTPAIPVAVEEAAFPIEEYDTLNVKKVERALVGLGLKELEQVMLYEKANKNRKTVIRAVQTRVDRG